MSDKFDNELIKGTIKFEFDPEHPEHTRTLKNMLNHSSWYCALFELNQRIRMRVKHEELAPEAYEALDKVLEEMYDLLDTYNISFDDYR